MIDRASSFDYKCYSFKAMFFVCIPMVWGQGRLSIGYIGKFCFRNVRRFCTFDGILQQWQRDDKIIHKFLFMKKSERRV